MQWDICELAYPNEYNGVYLYIYIYIYLNILNYDIRNKPYTSYYVPLMATQHTLGIQVPPQVGKLTVVFPNVFHSGLWSDDNR